LGKFFKAIMKYNHALLGLLAGTALLVASGCSKEQPSVTPTGDNAAKVPEAAATATPPPAPAPVANAPAAPSQPPAEPPVVKAPEVPTAPVATAPAAAAPQPATDQLQALAAAVTNQVAAALGTTNQLASMATTQVQALLDQAKSLTANQKYQEALTTLTELYNTQLTPEQKQQADALKAQIQTAMSQKASSALDNFLGGKKQ
jgi:hypothetical protein